MLTETLTKQDANAVRAIALADEAPPPQTVEAPALAVNERSILGLVELLLKAPARLDTWTREPARQVELVPRLLILALTSLALFSTILALLLRAASPEAVPFVLENWNGSTGAAVALALAYPIGMAASSGICLPTFYFFGLLAGIRISVLQVTTLALKGTAATAILLLGLTPIYLSVTLGMAIFHADDKAMSVALTAGLILPFLSGVWGLRLIYVGFLSLADTLPPERRYRRTYFLRRLTVAWAAVYTAVTPVMIWSLNQHLAARLG